MSEHLSEHFTVQEFENSQWACRHGKSNRMDDIQRERAKHLCEEVLEKVRSHFGAPVIVTSGYRSKQVNHAVGGAPSSQHMYAEAADIQVIGHSAYEVAAWIIEESDIEFDQCIYEYDSWTHVSKTQRYANRKESLTINKNGRKEGLHVT